MTVESRPTRTPDYGGDVARRARVHAALGEPARLAIVDHLVLGDASPTELRVALDMPGNLLTHHLKVLLQAGVVARSPSEGDRRRSYLRLLPAAGAALSQGVVVTPERVVFVCSHNSARSQLAAALWTARSTVPAASGGTEPADRVHPGAVAAARRHHLRLPRRRPVHISGVLRRGDLLISVCDAAHERLAAAASPRLHWSIPDPVRAGTQDAFNSALVDIEDRVSRLAESVALNQEAVQ